jgi:multiple sugar transport system permease protein
MLIGTLFALLLSQNIRGISIFRSIQIIPIVATPIVLAVVWRFLLDPTAGPLRLIFKQLGMSNIALLSSSKYTLLTVVLIDVWIWAPFVTIIILGAISMLPQEPFEAASIDGASKLQQFFYLTLPFLKQALIISATLRFVDSLKTFGVVWVLTKGGPGFATNILGLEIYQRGFKFYHYAEAAGLGILLIFLAIFAGNIFFKSSKGAEL